MAWNLIKYAVPGYNHADHKEWMVDTKEDVVASVDTIKDNLHSATYDNNFTYWSDSRSSQSLLGKTIKLYIDGELAESALFKMQDFADFGTIPCAFLAEDGDITFGYDNSVIGDQHWFLYFDVSGGTPASHTSIKITTEGATPVLPANLGAPGSVVYTANLKNLYMVNSSGQLVTIQEET